MEISEFVLRNEGADVTKAWNGQEAVETIQKKQSLVNLMSFLWIL